MRKLEREIIRNTVYARDHNYKAFGSEWQEYKNKKHGEAKPKDTSKKKHRHYDSKNNIISHMLQLKAAVLASIEESKREKEKAE